MRGTPYAGIGSRTTPADICALMQRVGDVLARRGFLLRSGGANGADRAFESGARRAGGAMEIFRPDLARRPGEIAGPKLPAWDRALAIAAEHHPAWPGLEPYVRALHARNVPQVLGRNLSAPSAFVLCWTPTFRLDADGAIASVDGGTGQAVRVARTYKVPVFHLGHLPHRERIEAMLRESQG